jgi:hypothetical protein
MSPVRTSKDGCYRFGRDFTRLGVGRIQRSSGAHNLKEFRRRDGILTKLAEGVEIDILRAFQRGDVQIEQLVEADRKGDVRVTLADIQLRQPLWPAADHSIAESGCSDATRKRYSVSLAALRRKASTHLPDDAKLTTLVEVP